MTIEIRPLTPDRQADFLGFFEGDAFADNPKWSSCYCQCLYVDHNRVDWAARTAAENRAQACERIGARRMQGYLAYRESGKTPGLVRARQMIFEDRARITPLWVKGHRGEPLNEGADALARLASRYALGDSALDAAEYHRRASDLAVTFSREFTRARSA